MKTDDIYSQLIKELEELAEEANNLKQHPDTLGRTGPKFTDWRRRVKLTLSRIPDAGSAMLKEFEEIQFQHPPTISMEQDAQTWFRRRLDEAKDLLVACKADIKKRMARHGYSTSRIFIVHGRQKDTVRELEQILKDWGLEPVLLYKQASQGRTLIEKFEAYSPNVGYAIVLLTADDEGRLKGEQELKSRARQNVVFELGHFFGSLGRERTCCIYQVGVELPTDIHGIVYVPFGKSVLECKEDLRKELAGAGFNV